MQLIAENTIAPKQHQAVFFDRPVNPVRKQTVAILAGRHSSLYEIEKTFEIVRAMNHHPVVIADINLKDVGVPAELYLELEKNKIHYHNADEAINIITECKILIAGIGLELNSALQLLLSAVFDVYSGTTILSESTLKFTQIDSKFSTNSLLISSTKGLLKNADRLSGDGEKSGLIKKLDIISNAHSQSYTRIICAEDYQLLGVDLESKKAGIINYGSVIDLTALQAILVNLLADRALPLAEGWLDYFFAAGYLYKEVYVDKKNPSSLKDFLNSQF